MFLFSTFFLLPFFSLFSFLPLHAKLTDKEERKQRGVVVTAILFSQEKGHVEIKAKAFFKLSNYSFLETQKQNAHPFYFLHLKRRKGRLKDRNSLIKSCLENK